MGVPYWTCSFAEAWRLGKDTGVGGEEVGCEREREKVIDWQRNASMLSLFSLSLLSSNHSLIMAMFLESLAEAVCSSLEVKAEIVGSRAN